MRFRQDEAASAALLACILLSQTANAAGSIDCARVIADKHAFDLSALDGPHSVMNSLVHVPATLNTTYTLNLCRPLVPTNDQGRCPGPTRVCAIERTINPEEKTDTVSQVIPIAGDLQDYHGTPMDVTLTRLKTSASTADSEREGLRIEMTGGNYLNREQKAIVELICDASVDGTESCGFEPEDKYKTEAIAKRWLGSWGRRGDGAEATDESTPNNETCTPSLSFKKYGAEGDIDVLRLEWRTRYACESLDDGDARQPSAHWGFFTWFIIIAFMGTAAYLIFGSWLNYNRYGARGWDLLPHGDTIRDLPYLLKDWSRSVFSTVQGSGSRGGYSAV